MCMNVQNRRPQKRIASFIKKCLRYTYQHIIDIPVSNKQITKLKKHKTLKTGRIKVGFIVQVPELWSKQVDVFNTMLRDTFFDPWLIIVPPYNFGKCRLDEFGEEKEFFINASQGKFLLARENGKWRDIRNDEFDYVFYQRPYDNYLPDSFRSLHTSRYTRICYIPYATPEMKDTTIYPYEFFKNIYLGFMEDEHAAQLNNRRFHDKTNTRFLNIGYPPFQRCLSINSRCNYKMVLWAPRWSYDPIVGGSHFFEYVDKLTGYPWGEIGFMVRPHPLMWSNFLKEKIISEREIVEIQNKWKELGILIDKNREIERTFETVDILISDRSSIIPMFFLTGKPIVFCPPEKADYSFIFKTIIPGLYIANNENELTSMLSSLLAGEDPLKENREEIIKSDFVQHSSAIMNIITMLKKDSSYE